MVFNSEGKKLLKKKSILLIEDDSALRCLLKEFLEDEYLVFEASNYREAINQAKNHIDIAVIDYSLPGREFLHI